MRRSFLAVAVVLPLIVLALGMVRAERHLGENRRWIFEATGYDPRDLLRGHYIIYRLALDETDPAFQDAEQCRDDSGDRCCLCLSAETPGGPTKVQRTTCEFAYGRCEGALQSQYLSELQRYYIPEERAAEITRLFQDASREHRAQLVVAVDKSGRPQIDTLLVDDIPI